MTERDYIALAAQYQADVLAGAIPACAWVKLACERNRRDLDRQGTLDFPFVFDPEKARVICQMAEMLPHIKGPKAKVIGKDEQGRNIWNPIVLEPWQCWIFCTMFGWVREDGLRRFRVGLILVPRKNAKSTMGAIIALYMLTADGESGAECYSAATTRDQAKAIAEIAWEMARRSPAFCEYFGVRIGSETTRSLAVPGTASKFMPLSADANSLDGLNVSCALVDELHAHQKASVWQVLDTGTGARLQPWLIGVTTAGVDVAGICHQKLDYLRRVLDGTAVDETYFGVEYTIDAEDDIRRVEVQRKANPNYGVSVQPDDLERKVAEAQVNQAELNNVLTKHFNVWIRSEAAWMTASMWQTCMVAGLKEDALKAYPLWIGVDLGETRDPSSLALLFKLSADTYALIPRIYLPAEAIAKSPTAEMSGWVRAGHVIETPGNEADYARIEADLLDLHKRFKVKEIDFDRRSARIMMQSFRKSLETTLGRDKVASMVLDIPQNVDTMDPAMKMAEAMVIGKRLQHDGNPAMAWMVSNISVERDHKGQIYPRKSGGKDSVNKIDAAIAYFTALSQAMQHKPEPTYSVYFAGGRR